MAAIPYSTALIVGAGPGISASVARVLAAAGLKLGVAARNIDKRISPLATGADFLKGETAAGTKITFCKRSVSIASRARMRCP